jgi:pSer/pThr/pTyr-binding forkhead associated (FHA) protein
LTAVFESDWERKAPASDNTTTQVMRAFDRLSPESADEVAVGFVLISRTNALVRHAIREGLTTIGRAQENDIVITDALVSRHHAQITLDAGTCRITDLGSGNGTFLNGDRIDGSTWLRPGDVLRIAESEEFRLLEI